MISRSPSTVPRGGVERGEQLYQDRGETGVRGEPELAESPSHVMTHSNSDERVRGGHPPQVSMACAKMGSRCGEFCQRLVVDADTTWARGHSFRAIPDLYCRSAMALGASGPALRWGWQIVGRAVRRRKPGGRFAVIATRSWKWTSRQGMAWD